MVWNDEHTAVTIKTMLFVERDQRARFANVKDSLGVM